MNENSEDPWENVGKKRGGKGISVVSHGHVTAPGTDQNFEKWSELGGRRAAVIGFQPSRRHGARRRGQQEIEKPKSNFCFRNGVLPVKDTSIVFSSAGGRTRTEDGGREQSAKRAETTFYPTFTKRCIPLFCDVIKTTHVLLSFMLPWLHQGGRFTSLQTLQTLSSDCLDSLISSKQ